MGNEETSVKFNLWAVLGFLTILFLTLMGGLYSLVSTGRAERIANNQIVTERLKRLETNYSFIAQGIAELKLGQEKMSASLDEHKRQSAR